MKLESLIKEYRDEIIKSTQEIIKIKSVEEEGKPGAPFGDGPAEALNYALKLSESLGFQTENFDGYAGHADLGTGDETVGILVHLDIVPEGDGWTYPPYGGEIHDGKLYGRGTIDDKGPAIAALYAMKAIKESGLPIKKKIRIIFGTNEETGWGGVDYYFDKVKAPDMAFTPDADFPVIHGEKGVLVFDLCKTFKDTTKRSIKIKSINGGNRPNMVPDLCTATLELNEDIKDSFIDAFNKYVEKNGYDISMEDNGSEVVLKSVGVSAHGSLPHSGQNAISQLIGLFNEIEENDSEALEFLRNYNDLIGMEYYGQSIGCGFEDDISGKLIFNVGIIEMNETEAKAVVNVRYPISNTAKDVYDGVKKAVGGTGIEVQEGADMAPIYVPEDNELVQTLMKVYREVTGDIESKPITIGGGTYARAMKNAVAFGPLFPGQEEVAHQKDEFIGIEDLMKCTEIFAKALYELAK